MLGAKLVSSLMGQANQSGEKSTVVHTLIWMIAVIFIVVVMLVIYKAPTWVLASVLTMAMVGCLFFGYVFIYCLKKDPDLLRSERLVLQKMAIERHVIGDSVTGEQAVAIKADDSSGANHIRLTDSSPDSPEDK